MKSSRKKIPSNIETEVLTNSGRRCCLCVYIDGDYAEKMGQIAHLDHNPDNNDFDNLAYLCLEHHSKYDSSTSQHKNYTQREVKKYRNMLYNNKDQIIFKRDIDFVREAEDKPFALSLDGVNDTLLYNSKELLLLEEYEIECNFRLSYPMFAGTILAINNKFSYIYFKYFSKEHPKYPGYLCLIKYEKKYQTNKIHSCIEITSADLLYSLKIYILPDKITFSINNQKNILFINTKKYKFNEIQLGANRIFPGNKYKNFSFLNYFYFYLFEFKIFDLKNKKIVCYFPFHYGYDYLSRLPNFSELNMIGGDLEDQFIKIPKVSKR